MTGSEHVEPPSSMTASSTRSTTPASSVFTHQVRRYRCAAPIGRNSGCGRGKEMRCTGYPHCSRSLLWQLSTGGAGEGRQAVHPAERPVERQRGLRLDSFIHLLKCVYSKQISWQISISYVLIFPASLDPSINKHKKSNSSIFTCMHPLIPFWTSPEPSTPPTCRCFTFKPWISFPTITVP